MRPVRTDQFPPRPSHRSTILCPSSEGLRGLSVQSCLHWQFSGTGDDSCATRRQHDPERNHVATARS